MDVKHIAGGVHEGNARREGEQVREGSSSRGLKNARMHGTRSTGIRWYRYDGVTCTVVRLNLCLLLARGVKG